MEPYAEKTLLGWVIAGPVQTHGHAGTEKLVCRAHVSEAEYTNHQLRMFWDVDTFGVRVNETPMYSLSEQRAMKIMKDSCRRVDSGYELALLWKPDRPPLPKNYTMAMRRLESVERRLQKDPNLAEGYGKAIGAYVEKGFARKLTDAERAESTEEWLLPHHPVCHRTSRYPGSCLTRPQCMMESALTIALRQDQVFTMICPES